MDNKIKRFLSAALSVLMAVSMGTPQMAYAADTTSDNTQDITVKVTWDDNDDSDKIRPDNITLSLYGDNGIRDLIASEPETSDTNAIIAWCEKAKAWSEKNIPSYMKQHVMNNIEENAYKIIFCINHNIKGWENYYETIKHDLPYWKDDNTVSDPIIKKVSKDTWTATFQNVPKQAGGEDIQYEVIGSPVKDYSTREGTASNDYTVEYWHCEDTTDITAKVLWDDENDADKVRPYDGKIVLAKTEDEDPNVVERESNSHDKYSEIGAIYGWYRSWPINKSDVDKYVPVELDVPDDYTVTRRREGNTYIFTNTHKVDGKRTIRGKVIWDDKGHEDQRPDFVDVDLYSKDTGSIDGDIVKVNQKDTEFPYAIVPDKNLRTLEYGKGEAKFTEAGINGDTTYLKNYYISNNGFDITLKWVDPATVIEPETITPSGKITWNDKGHEDQRPDSVKLTLMADGEDTDKSIIISGSDTSYSFPEVPKQKDGKDIVYTVKEEPVENYTTTYDGMNITNTYAAPKPATKDISGKIIWNDDNNKDDKRPENVTIHLYADGKDTGKKVSASKNDASYQFEKVNVKDGNKNIQYSVKEDNIKSYEISYDGLDVTNTYKKTEAITPSGTITWDDKDDTDKVRPESVKITLYADGKATDQTVTVKSTDKDFAFKAVPKQADGKDIKYTVKEDAIDGYEITYDGMNVMNKHTVKTISIPVKVVWDDNDNQDGKRPDNVKVQVLGQKGDAVMTISGKDGWTASFDDQKDAKFTVTAGDVKDYTAAVSGDNEHGYVVTYKHTPETTKVTVEVKWDDKGFEKERPDKITADITADGEKVKTVTISKDDDWKAEEDLPKYKDGKEIKYALVGKDVEKYSLSVKGSTITYTRVAKMTQLSAEVVWKDNDDAAKKRPSSVQIQLYANGQAKGIPVTLKNGAWKHTFSSLEAEDGNSNPVVYTVDEVKVPDGYTKNVTNVSGEFTITNTYTPVSTGGSQDNSKVNIAGKITWNDQNDADRIRPKSVTVTLNANGKAIARKVVKADDNWAFDFGSRDKNDTSGKAITYTVTQRTITGYATTISGFNITNTHTPKGSSTSITENPVQGSNPTPDNVSSGTAAKTDQAVRTNAVQTGDTANAVLYAVIAAVAGGALIILAVRGRKHTDM